MEQTTPLLELVPPVAQVLSLMMRIAKLFGAESAVTPRGEMDEEISCLFQEWLSAFDAVQVASGEEAITRAHSRLSEIETQIANTRGEGLKCLVIKLGLHCFLNADSDAASLQFESAYRDLVRLTGRDPAAEISARFGQDAPRHH